MSASTPVGAYTYALLAMYFGMGFLDRSVGRRGHGGAVWLPARLPGTAPARGLSGDRDAGFGEIIRILLNNMTWLTNGPNGIGGIPKPTFFGLEFSRRASEGMQTFHEFFGIDFNSSHRVIFIYLLALALVLFTLFVINRLLRMLLAAPGKRCVKMKLPVAHWASIPPRSSSTPLP